MRTEEVIVLSYQESWKDNFEKIAQELRAVLGELATRIEHVGSTAVEGLAAKPIIDIDVVIAQETALSMVIEKLASIGYVHEGNLGIEGREAFAYSGKEHLQCHHLYVCPENSLELKRHLAFAQSSWCSCDLWSNKNESSAATSQKYRKLHGL